VAELWFELRKSTLQLPNQAQVSELIEELGAGGAAALDVTQDDGLVPRLLAYSRSVAGFPTAIKEVGVHIRECRKRNAHHTMIQQHLYSPCPIVSVRLIRGLPAGCCRAAQGTTQLWSPPAQNTRAHAAAIF